MDAGSIIKELVARRGLSNREFSRSLGESTPLVIGMYSRGNPSVRVLTRYLDALGCDLVVVPKGAKLPPDHFIVTYEKPEPEPEREDPEPQREVYIPASMPLPVYTGDELIG